VSTCATDALNISEIIALALIALIARALPCMMELCKMDLEGKFQERVLSRAKCFHSIQF
jgi:hypothetical protein